MTRTKRRVEAAHRAPRGLRAAARGRRRLAALAVAGVAALGLGSASAAGLAVEAATLAAGTGDVSSCQAGALVSADLVSTWSDGEFRTTAVRLDGVAAGCVGQAYRISIVDAAGRQLAEVSGQVGATAFTSPAFEAVPTPQIDHVAVVIHS